MRNDHLVHMLIFCRTHKWCLIIWNSCSNCDNQSIQTHQIQQKPLTCISVSIQHQLLNLGIACSFYSQNMAEILPNKHLTKYKQNGIMFDLNVLHHFKQNKMKYMNIDSRSSFTPEKLIDFEKKILISSRRHSKCSTLIWLEWTKYKSDPIRRNKK